MSAWLSPLAWLYRQGVARRNRRFDRGLDVHRVPVPVISVGNLTVGGTGKTPVVARLAADLAGAGARPAVVSRGYGGQAGAGPLRVGDGNSPPEQPASVVGDEPFLLATRLRGVQVWVGSDRVAGARAAIAAGADCVLLDDGFQHRRLARDLDLLLIDGRHGVGNGRLLPAGPLREPPSSIVRAHRVVMTGSGPGDECSPVEALVARNAPDCPVTRCSVRPEGFFDREGRRHEPPGRAFGFCGIARPERFLRMLEAQVPNVAGFERFADHHPFTVRERRRLARLAREADAVPVTTEKDLARLPAGTSDDLEPLFLRIEAEFHDGGALVRQVRHLAGCGGGA